MRRRGSLTIVLAVAGLGTVLGSCGGGGGAGAPPYRSLAGQVVPPDGAPQDLAGVIVDMYVIDGTGLSTEPIDSVPVDEAGRYAFDGAPIPEGALAAPIARVAVGIGGVAFAATGRKDLDGGTTISLAAMIQLVLSPPAGGRLLTGPQPAAFSDVSPSVLAVLEAAAPRFVGQTDFTSIDSVNANAGELLELTRRGTQTPPPDAVCGDGVDETVEACDLGDGNVAPGTCPAGQVCCTTTCAIVEGEAAPPPVCGDGTQEAGEACDDGAANVAPGTCAANETCCTTACTVESGPTSECGDGGLDAGEQCDDGEANVAPSECGPRDICCTTQCEVVEGSGCGDGDVDGGEQCDEGEDNRPPSECQPGVPCCTTECQLLRLPLCGNGVEEAGEQCDTGTGNVDPAQCDAGAFCCSTSCEIIVGATCGNFVTEPPEACDDGPQGSRDCCFDCTLPDPLTGGCGPA